VTKVKGGPPGEVAPRRAHPTLNGRRRRPGCHAPLTAMTRKPLAGPRQQACTRVRAELILHSTRPFPVTNFDWPCPSPLSRLEAFRDPWN